MNEIIQESIVDEDNHICLMTNLFLKLVFVSSNNINSNLIIIMSL